MSESRPKPDEAFRQYRKSLAVLEPGDAMLIPLPDSQPAARIAYQCVARAAHMLWGAGSYSIKSTRSSLPSVQVVRKATA